LFRTKDGVATVVDQTDLLRVLNSVSFPERYWDLCDRFPLDANGLPRRGRKEDVLGALRDLCVAIDYDKRDRSYVVERERIDATTWWGVFVMQRGGVEMLLASDAGLGSNFAALARSARR
jgi:hypothetical protein